MYNISSELSIQQYLFCCQYKEMNVSQMLLHEIAQ